VQAVATDTPSAPERFLRRDRLVVAAGLAALAGLAWLYLFASAREMQAMAANTRMHEAMGMADMRVWGAADFAALAAMWSVMMAAMMLPSAAPVILLVLGVYRRRGDRQAGQSTSAFLSGYLLAWIGFSVIAAAAQLVLHRAALLTPDMAARSTTVSGIILLLAGTYQWLPVKAACLSHCQSPLGFLAQRWREGVAGAFGMGTRHGLFCVGCCWALMVLLFAVGVMNLLWVAAIGGFVLLEKLWTRMPVGRAAGVLLGGWGVYLLFR
jgi:predicted metal-binding membrane protein